MKDKTWVAWTFRIGDKAFRHIRPMTMELVQEKQISSSSGMLWWRRHVEEYTGRWVIRLKYDMGPGTFAKVDNIHFDSENQARFWFEQTYSSVFLNTRDPIVPKPKHQKPQPKKPNLRLL